MIAKKKWFQVVFVVGILLWGITQLLVSFDQQEEKHWRIFGGIGFVLSIAVVYGQLRKFRNLNNE